MGNVLRVLGIVLASMLLGLVGLFLLLFTICGGLESSDGGGVLAICLLVMAGSVGSIVFLGRGLAVSRAASRGLAVPPAGAALAAGATAAPPPPRLVPPLRPLAGTDQQALVGLRVCLLIYVLLSLGSMAFNVATFGRYGGGNVAVQLILRSLVSMLPPAALLIAVSVRNPPAAMALDAVAGLGIASIVFRFGYLGFAGAFVSAFNQTGLLAAMLPRLAGYSAIEAGIAALALHLRSRVGPISPPALVLATIAFLFWNGIVQVVMQALLALTY